MSDEFKVGDRMDSRGNPACTACGCYSTTPLCYHCSCNPGVINLRTQLAEAKEEIELLEVRAHSEAQGNEANFQVVAELEGKLVEYEQLFDLQHKRTLEADKLWQKAHDKPHVFPDLGELIGWLLKRLEAAERNLRVKLGNQIGPAIFKNRELLCSSHSGKGTGLECSECVADVAEERDKFRRERDEARVENERLRAWADCFYQFASDENDEPIDGWEEAVEQYDQGETEWIDSWRTGTALAQPEEKKDNLKRRYPAPKP